MRPQISIVAMIVFAGALSIGSVAHAALDSSMNFIPIVSSSIPKLAPETNILDNNFAGSIPLFHQIDIGGQLASAGLKIVAPAQGSSAPAQITQTTLSIDARQANDLQPYAAWEKMWLQMSPQVIFPTETYIGTGSVDLVIENTLPNTTYSVDIKCYNNDPTNGTISWAAGNPAPHGAPLSAQASFPSTAAFDFISVFLAPTHGMYRLAISSNRNWIFDSVEVTAIPSSVTLVSN